MKKLLIVLLALTIVGIFAVAEDAPAASISLGAWGRGWFSPMTTTTMPEIDEDTGLPTGDLKASTPGYSAGPSWSGFGARVGVKFIGNSENVGFFWNPGVSGTDMDAVCDEAKIWVKPNSMFKVEVGAIHGDVLRGKIGDFGDMLPVAGEDDIFQRFATEAGMLLNVTPMDGLYIGAAMDAAKTPSFNWDFNQADLTTLSDFQDLADKGDDYSDWAADGTPYAEWLKMIQIGAGYVIPNIGHARVQYIGDGATSSLTDNEADALNATLDALLGTTGSDEFKAGMVYSKTSYIQAAFAYTGMEGLLIDAGFRMPTNADYQMLFAVAANYSKDALSATARFNAYLGGDSDIYVFNYKSAAQVVYSLQAPLAVGAEIAFTGMSALDVDDSDARIVDVYPFVKLGYGNGYMKVGFDAKVGLDDQPMTYQLPVLLEYWF